MADLSEVRSLIQKSGLTNLHLLPGLNFVFEVEDEASPQILCGTIQTLEIDAKSIYVSVDNEEDNSGNEIQYIYFEDGQWRLSVKDSNDESNFLTYDGKFYPAFEDQPKVIESSQEILPVSLAPVIPPRFYIGQLLRIDQMEVCTVFQLLDKSSYRSEKFYQKDENAFYAVEWKDNKWVIKTQVNDIHPKEIGCIVDISS